MQRERFKHKLAVLQLCPWYDKHSNTQYGKLTCILRKTNNYYCLKLRKVQIQQSETDANRNF